MPQFAADIAFMLEVFAISLSLVLFHYASKEQSIAIRLAAILLLIAGILGIVCTTYFWFTYYNAGVFEASNLLSTR